MRCGSGSIESRRGDDAQRNRGDNRDVAPLGATYVPSVDSASNPSIVLPRITPVAIKAP